MREEAEKMGKRVEAKDETTNKLHEEAKRLREEVKLQNRIAIKKNEELEKPSALK